MVFLVFNIITFIVIGTKDAYAYIDPGTGSFFFQTIVALVLGSLYVVKVYWVKIKTIANKFVHSITSKILKR